MQQVLAFLTLAAASTRVVTALTRFETNDDTPVGKVITLLQDLKTEVEEEGAKEAKAYNEFACFCQKTSSSKSNSILKGNDQINELSADIQEKTSLEAEKGEKKMELQKQQAEVSAELEHTTSRCAKDAAEYEASNADLVKALKALENAKKALSAAKPAPESLLAIQQTIESSKALAHSLGLVSVHRVDPQDAAYEYHSEGIIETIEELAKTFQSTKDAEDEEWMKTKTTCDKTTEGLKDELATVTQGIEDRHTEAGALAEKLSKAKEDLVNSESTLKDDQLYLKDLTKMCEERAKDWDQRSHMRGSELEALAGALAILKDKVSGLDKEVNKRAMMLLKQGQRKKSAVQAPSFLQEDLKDNLAKQQQLMSDAADLVSDAADLLKGSQATVQEARETLAAVDADTRVTKPKDALVQSKAVVSLGARQQSASKILQEVAGRTGSTALSMLAVHITSDPFAKVKELIQKLIERLLKEATAEASKKGFCDEQMGKAENDRDFRFEDVSKLSLELANLETTEDALTAEIESLTEALKKLNRELKEATELRGKEKTDNHETLTKAKDGLEAVAEALMILKNFYSKAESMLQASPVDEDTSGPGFSGEYKGKVAASKGVIGILEVIKSDFERTIRTTESSESKAEKEFVEFDRASKADIAGKETKKGLSEQDLKTTKADIEQTTSDLEANSKLLDDAVKSLEALHPTCVDTGMSYKERQEKRETEMKALKNALCILDPEGKEEECED